MTEAVIIQKPDYSVVKERLTLFVLWIPESCIEIKMNLNLYFHTLWRLKRFYEGPYGLYKTFWDTTKKCENKNLS